MAEPSFDVRLGAAGCVACTVRVSSLEEMAHAQRTHKNCDECEKKLNCMLAVFNAQPENPPSREAVKAACETWNGPEIHATQLSTERGCVNCSWRPS